MLTSVVEDLSRLTGVHVATTWDSRLELPAGLCVASAAATSAADAPNRVTVEICDADCDPGENAARRFCERAAASDAVLVIAPEFDDQLAQRCAAVERLGRRSLNASPAAIRLCADKLALSALCEQLGVPTIPTRPATASTAWERTVLKRRDGAGSVGMRRCDSRRQLETQLRHRDPDRWIVQPYVPGIPLSAAALFDRGELISLWPIARQRLSDAGDFAYLGGEIPAPELERGPVERLLVGELAKFRGTALDGLHGFVGCDLLWTPKGELLLVEINPRLTTSWLGYRALCRQNPAAWLLEPRRTPPASFTGSVVFHSDGRIATMRP